MLFGQAATEESQGEAHAGMHWVTHHVLPCQLDEAEEAYLI